MLSKVSDDAQAAINTIRGIDNIQFMYSDGSPELQACMKRLNIVHDRSAPGAPTNNARAERANRYVMEGARAILLNARLPIAFWPYVVKYCCLCHNATTWKDKTTPWEKRWGHIFPYPIESKHKGHWQDG